MTDPQDVTVELRYDGDWHDITDDVLVGEPITVTRGRDSETQRIAPTRLTLWIENNDGTYSPRNPESSLYGKIGRNTQIRVGCGSPAASGYWRFHGEVEAWPQRWTLDATEDGRGVAWVPIQAYGITRRLGGLGQASPIQSAQYRAHTSGELATGLIGWWSLESGDQREQGSSPSGLTDGEPLVASPGSTAVVTREHGLFGGVTPGPPGAASATDLSGGAQLTAGLPVIGSTDPYRLEASIKLDTPENPAAVYLLAELNPEGTDWIAVAALDSSGWKLGVFWQGPPDGQSYVAMDIADGAWHHLRLDLSSSGGGADTAYALYVDGASVVSGTITGYAYTRPLAVQLSGTGDIDQAAHLGVWAGSSMPTALAGYDAFTGHAGETTAERLDRLATEESLPLTVIGDADTALGPQRTLPLLELLHESIETDGGFLLEDRDSFQLIPHGLDALYNLDAVTLSYTGHEISPPLEPSEDTTDVTNDVTVERVNGGFSRVTQDTGPLNVQEPDDDPEGVGRYPIKVTLNLETDDQTLQVAGWYLNRGVYDAARFPSVTVDLTALEEAGKDSLVAAIVALDVGDRLQLDDMPVWAGSGDQIIQGYTEVIGSHTRSITFNTTPYGPYTVGVLNSSTLARLDSRDSGLTTGINATTTSMSVGTSGARWIDSATYSSSFPFDVLVGGEQMTVTAITGTSSPQTFTVTRSVNGVVKSHGTLTPVHVWQPLRLAR